MKRMLAAMLTLLMLVNPVLACVAEEAGVLEEPILEFAEACEEAEAEPVQEIVVDSAEISVAEVTADESTEESAEEFYVEVTEMHAEATAADATEALADESVAEAAEPTAGASAAGSAAMSAEEIIIEFAEESVEEPVAESTEATVEETEAELDEEPLLELLEEPEEVIEEPEGTVEQQSNNMLSRSSTLPKVVFTSSKQDGDPVCVNEYVTIQWDDSISSRFMVNVKLLDGAPTNRDDEAGTALIPPQTVTYNNYIHFMVPDAKGRYIKVNVLGSDLDGNQTEQSSWIYLYIHDITKLEAPELHFTSITVETNKEYEFTWEPVEGASYHNAIAMYVKNPHGDWLEYYNHFGDYCDSSLPFIFYWPGTYYVDVTAFKEIDGTPFFSPYSRITVTAVGDCPHEGGWTTYSLASERGQAAMDVWDGELLEEHCVDVDSSAYHERYIPRIDLCTICLEPMQMFYEEVQEPHYFVGGVCQKCDYGSDEMLTGAPAVNSVTASQTILSNGQAQATYTVKTTANTTSVKMYSEDGTLIKTFNSSNASYSTSGSVRTWTLKYAFSNDGTRTMSFAASDGSTTSAKKAYTVTLYGVQVKSAAFSPSSVKVGTAAKATIKTNSGANYLHMYSEDGNWIKTWTASSNSTVSGGVRTWNISYAFAVAGNRTMTFKASRDNANPKAGVTAKVTVTSGTASTSITSVGASTTSVTAKNTLKFTIKTPTSANYIKMYAENGGLVKTWSGNSYYTTSGSVRTWTLPYAFSNAGNRTVTFKASNSGSDLSAGKSISIKVLAIPNVTSASASVTTVTAKNTMTFTAKTPTNAYSLSLYAEDGSKVKTWNSSGNSTVSGSVRTWKVSYAFSGAGNRRVTLKASANGVQYGTGKTLAITVLPVPSVSMALFAEDTVMRGEQTSIIVMSSTNGYYLHMFLENGTLYKTWNASGNSTVSGSTRVWQVPYTFSGAGTRKLTFKVSANNAHYGTGKTATIVVQ